MQTGAYAMLEASKYFSRHPLTADEKDALYQETTQVWRNLGVIEKEIPATYSELVAHVENVIETQLYASKVSRDVLRVTRKPPALQRLPRLLNPLWQVAIDPIARMQYFVLAGTTPEGARRKLEIEWTPADELTLRALGRVVAHTVPLLPERLRYFPIAYEARQLERSRRRLRKVLELRPL
jgi:uncharacterized protein (DUF2236 family)